MDRQLYGMNLYLDMLLIFQIWHKQIFKYKYALAQEAFYYTGQSGITSCVYFLPSKSQKDDQPCNEHKRFSYNYLMIEFSQNIVCVFNKSD